MIVPHSPTSEQWTLKIQDLESQRQHLLESTKKAMDEAGKEFLSTTLIISYVPQMLTLHGELGIKSPMSPNASIAFAALSEETEKQLKPAQEQYKKIAAEVSSSLRTEKYQLEDIKRLIAIPLDQIELYKSAAEFHHGSGKVNEETFLALNLQISQKKEALAAEKKKYFKDDQQIHELEFEILTLEQKRIIFDYKLLVQKFAKESIPILKRIQAIAEAEYLGEGKLAQLKLEIAAYTQKCNELQKDLDIIKMGIASNKIEISMFHAAVQGQKGLAEGFTKKIENLKKDVEHDIGNFTSLEERLTNEMNVSAVASHYERRIETGKRTIELIQQKEDAERELGKAQNKAKALQNIKDLIRKQADLTIRLTAVQVSPNGNTPYENFLRAFAIDARARQVPEDQWADVIVAILEQQLVIPNTHKQLFTDNIKHALGQMGLINVPLAEHRNSF
ncbi:MAG: hypothetical protein JSR39_07090 [Verrucomicrobia bacterium]|nr:hypothetical protein [Verrucomicrobiota bacterium]